MKDTIQEFAEYYSTYTNKEHVSTAFREDKLRVSGFPYCGLRHVYKRMVQFEQKFNFGEAYYTGVGIIAHAAVQHSLGYGRQMFGNWTCSEPGCRGSRTFSNNNRCPACRSVMTYHEFLLDLRHIYPYLSRALLDGVFRDSKGHYYVVDYKTTNIKTAQAKGKDSHLPYIANVAQIKAYCALIELRFRIEIKGWILHYIARDSPIKIHKTIGDTITTKEKKLILSKIQTYNDDYIKVMNCTSYNTVKELYNTKPCKTVEQYQEEYQGYGGCPLAHICFEPKMVKKELTRAWADREDNFLTLNRPRYIALPKL
jgi:hypothetical protein